MALSQTGENREEETMNDPNPKNHLDHWHAIAEQLGLAPDNGFPQPVREPEPIVVPEPPQVFHDVARKAFSVPPPPAAHDEVSFNPPAHASTEISLPEGDLFGSDEPLTPELEREISPSSAPYRPSRSSSTHLPIE